MPAVPDPTPRSVRLIVPGPGGRRVLARPNGLAGWTLPRIPMSDDRTWDATATSAATRLLGGAVAPVRRVEDAAGPAWEVEVRDRLPAVGVTWIPVDEAPRVGADAALVRRWAASWGRPGDAAPRATPG